MLVEDLRRRREYAVELASAIDLVERRLTAKRESLVESTVWSEELRRDVIVRAQ